MEILFAAQEQPDCPIDRCTLWGIYGGADTRVFVSGDPNAPATDWHSGLLDPTYFPQSGYTCIGDDDAPIMGYARQYQSQIIIKGEGSNGAAHYLRSWAVDGEGRVYFPVEQGMAGTGCIAPRTVASVDDHPIYLSGQGLCSWNSSTFDTRNNTVRRSNRIDKRLLKEADLDKAFGVIAGSKYWLFAGDHCYMADMMQISRDSSGYDQYEWYYLTDIPATAAALWQDQLWFGTEDGRLCRMKDEDEGSAYMDDDAPIAARWVTPYMDLGDNTLGKTVAAIHVTLHPVSGKTAAEVSCGTEDTYRQEIGTVSMQCFSWSTVDFNNFTFHTVEQPRTVRLPAKCHNIVYYQVALENSNDFENMALLELDVTYRTGRRIV